MKPIIDDVPLVAGMVVALKAPPQVGALVTIGFFLDRIACRGCAHN